MSEPSWVCSAANSSNVLRSIPLAGATGPLGLPPEAPGGSLALESSTVRKQPRWQGREPWKGFGMRCKNFLKVPVAEPGIEILGKKRLNIITPVLTSPNRLPPPRYQSLPPLQLLSIQSLILGEGEEEANKREEVVKEQPGVVPPSFPFRRRVVRPELPKDRNIPLPPWIRQLELQIRLITTQGDTAL